MKALSVLLLMLVALVSSPIRAVASRAELENSEADVVVGCQVWLDDQLAYDAPRFAHQPYVFSVEGKSRSGHERHYRVGVAFDGGRFSVQLTDKDRLVEVDGYERAAMIASASTELEAPNELNLTAGDSAQDDPVLRVVCSLTEP